MANNAPRKLAVELRMYGQVIGFMNFEDAYDPQREIQQQE